MAIDYVLAAKCQPQERLGVDRLVNLHRTRILARSMAAHMEADGDTRQPHEVEIQLTVRRAEEGDASRGVTLQDLLDEATPLDQVAPLCKQCPAELPREFACHRRIRYPIPEKVEAYLMARLPATLACTAGAFLVRGLGDFGWDGAPAAKLRAAGDTFFESRIPYGVRWEGPSGGTIELSSDQLFHMMFMVGHLSPTHCLMLALFLGVIPHDTDLHALKDTAGRARVLAAAHVANEADPELEQLAAFLRTLALAARLDVHVLVDG